MLLCWTEEQTPDPKLQNNARNPNKTVPAFAHSTSGLESPPPPILLSSEDSTVIAEGRPSLPFFR